MKGQGGRAQRASPSSHALIAGYAADRSGEVTPQFALPAFDTLFRSWLLDDYHPRDAQRDCCKKALVGESASQANSALSLSGLSISWKFHFITENTNATKKGLEPLHLIGTSRCVSCGTRNRKEYNP